MIRTYSELSRLAEFEERYRYLKFTGKFDEDPFGFDRHVKQNFYKSHEWKAVRDFVIVRDGGRDLGVEGFEIYGKILIHHMNQISPKDVTTRSEFLLDPEYLISTTHSTHNAIHFGDENLLVKAPVERRRYDTCPWKR
jgi:hypothetical protein